MGSSVSAESGWLEAAPAAAATPSEPACRPAGRIIAFFVVSMLLRGAMATVVHGLGLGPHCPDAL
eukprot:6504787-Pyramimonas_sp.AAC.1